MYYLLNRDEDYQIVHVTEGNDPLYGRGSWNLAGGPHDTWEEAEEDLIHRELVTYTYLPASYHPNK